MRLHFNMRFFFTRTFCLLLILLLMTGVLSAVMLTRLQNLYADQDSTQIDSLVTMVSEMIEERLSSRMGLLNETSHFPFQKPGSKSHLDSFLNSLSIKLNANELLKEKIGSTRFLVTDLNGILVGGEHKADLSGYPSVYMALRGFSVPSQVIEDIADDSSQGQKYFLLSVPVRLGSENVGSVSAIVPIGKNSWLISEIAEPYLNASLMLVDKAGSVISYKESLSETEHADKSCPTNFPQSSAILQEQTAKKLLHEAELNTKKIFSYNTRDTGCIVSITGIAETGGWKLVAVSSPQSIRGKQQAIIARAQRVFLYLLLLLTAIITTLGFVSWRSSWLQKLSDTMMDTSGIYLFSLNDDGTVFDFDRPLGALVGLSEDRKSFNLNNCLTAEEKSLLPAHFEQGATFKLCLHTVSGCVFLFVKVVDRNISGSMHAFAMDVTKDEIMRLKIEDLAYVDQLTKLPNTESFKARIAKTIKSQQPEDYQAACYFIEIKDCHKILEMFGSAVQKQLIREAALRLSSAAAAVNADVYSLDYDNFAVYYEFADDGRARQLAADIKACFAEPFRITNNLIKAECYIGVCLYNEYVKNTHSLAADIFRYGETANRLSKQEPNGICFLDDETYKKILERLDIEFCLKSSIENNELSLHFQPIYNSVEDRIVSLEALARWNSPKYGRVPPDVFIGMAEQCGYINELGDWVVREALGFAKKLEAYDVSVQFNVSVFQLAQTDFVDNLAMAVTASGVNPKRFGMEITESSGFEDAASMKLRLRPLKNIGMPIYIDDFGTGYSSMSYLKDISADFVKIDKSFVHGMLDSPEQREILKAVAELASALKLKVVAEGIEDKAELAMLLQMGYTNIQGYLIAKPMDEESVIKFIRGFHS